MKNSLTRIVLGAGFAGVALLSLSTVSWSMGHGGVDHDPQRMVAHMTERLDLDDGQTQKMEQILVSSREQIGPYREEMKSLRAQLEAMRDNFDPDSARAISERIGVITGEMVYQASRAKAQVYALLSQPQKKELNELMEKREQRRGKWHKKAENAD